MRKSHIKTGRCAQPLQGKFWLKMQANPKTEFFKYGRCDKIFIKNHLLSGVGQNDFSQHRFENPFRSETPPALCDLCCSAKQLVLADKLFKLHQKFKGCCLKPEEHKRNVVTIVQCDVLNFHTIMWETFSKNTTKHHKCTVI